MTFKPLHSAVPLCCVLLFVTARGKKKTDEEGGGDSGPADTTEYTIKTSLPRLDAPVTITSESKMEMRISASDPQGKLLKEFNNSKQETKSWTETMLAVEKNQEKDWTKMKIVFNRIEGEEGVKKLPVPKLVGRLSLDTEKGTTSGKLVRAYKKDGKQFGITDINGQFPFKETPTTKPKEGSKMTFTVRYDGCIDGSTCEATASATMDGNLDSTAAKGSLKMNFNAKLKFTETEKP